MIITILISILFKLIKSLETVDAREQNQLNSQQGQIAKLMLRWQKLDLINMMFYVLHLEKIKSREDGYLDKVLYLFIEGQYLNVTNPAIDQQLQSILNKNEQDEKLIRIDQKQIQEIQNELTYSERYVDYLNQKYHIPKDYSQKIQKIQQLKQQLKQELGISPQSSPRKYTLQKAQTFQLSPNHCIEPSLFVKNSYGAKRVSKLQKAQVDSIVDSLRQESKKQIDSQDSDSYNVRSMKLTRSQMLGSLLKRIQKQNLTDQSNINTGSVSSPLSKMKKSNSSIFATRFSRPTDRSFDQNNIQ
ncbi:unnamed protein product [Paramecium sonneborni]|uniref:Uncharacterized protein n=1 Tax=Paramecium sonneborni TaxID=65129 RepID=A0A8S1L908_9CILI|nr:unnamed protein product [Paramecium sonneborni]